MREHFLSNAAFARDEHRNIRFRNFRGHHHDFFNLLARTHKSDGFQHVVDAAGDKLGAL